MVIQRHLDTPDEIITLLYDGIIRDKSWQRFIEALRLRCDCDIAYINLRYHHQRHHPLVSFASGKTRGGDVVEEHMHEASGVYHETSINIIEDGGMLCSVGLISLDEQRDLSGDEKRLLEDLAPHIDRALRLYAKTLCGDTQDDPGRSGAPAKQRRPQPA